MSDPGSSLVFTTGVETLSVATPKTIDRWRLRRKTDDYIAGRALILIDKGYVEDAVEKWIEVPQVFVIQNYSAAGTYTWGGNTYTVPSGAHYDAWRDYTDANTLAEALEEATFAALESMNVVSGTPTPA